MTKLYYTPTSCGAASFIAAVAAGIHIDAEVVDIGTHKTASGEDYYKINPKGNVPGLVLDDGTVLNEGAAVLQWIADQAPDTVAPAYGTSNRYLVQAALNYTASEVHASFGPLFSNSSPELKTAAQEKIAKKLEYINDQVLKDRSFLVGDKFSIADSYLYIVLSWTSYVGVDLSPFPVVKAYFERIGALPVVQEAHAKMATKPSST